MAKDCGDCSNKSEQAKAYIDKKTGILRAEICEIYDKPEALVIVPFVCTACGTANWRVIDNRKNNENKS